MINEVTASILIIILTLLFITIVGNFVVQKVNSAPSSSPNGNGAKIGCLERLLYFIGIISQNWTLIALVIGLKTIGRFKKLDKQQFAEYFLIGSLTSLLYAMLVAFIFISLIDILDCNWIEKKLTNINIVQIK